MKKEDFENFEKILTKRLKKITSQIPVLTTGRDGAILFYRTLLEDFEKTSTGKELTEEKKKEIKEKSESGIWEDGVYKTNPETGLLEYQGLWDKNQPNGVHGCIVRGLYYIEIWFNGHRKAYKIVKEEEYERLKSISPEEFDFIEYFDLQKKDDNPNEDRLLPKSEAVIDEIIDDIEYNSLIDHPEI